MLFCHFAVGDGKETGQGITMTTDTILQSSTANCNHHMSQGQYQGQSGSTDKSSQLTDTHTHQHTDKTRDDTDTCTTVCSVSDTLQLEVTTASRSQHSCSNGDHVMIKQDIDSSYCGDLRVEHEIGTYTPPSYAHPHSNMDISLLSFSIKLARKRHKT